MCEPSVRSLPPIFYHFYVFLCLVSTDRMLTKNPHLLLHPIVQKYNLWGDPLLVVMVPFVVAIAYLTGWLLLWIALKVSSLSHTIYSLLF